jgi:hypothetical protein
MSIRLLRTALFVSVKRVGCDLDLVLGQKMCAAIGKCMAFAVALYLDAINQCRKSRTYGISGQFRVQHQGPKSVMMRSLSGTFWPMLTSWYVRLRCACT